MDERKSIQKWGHDAPVGKESQSTPNMFSAPSPWPSHLVMEPGLLCHFHPHFPDLLEPERDPPCQDGKKASTHTTLWTETIWGDGVFINILLCAFLSHPPHLLPSAVHKLLKSE